MFKSIFTIILMILLSGFLFAQQVNYTWGYDTTGTAYTQSGVSDLDTAQTVRIVFDMQDYYFWDWYPTIVNDVLTVTGSSSDTVGVDSIYGATVATVYDNSNRLYYGTFWYMWDLQNDVGDSLYSTIKVYPGHLTYYPGSGGRISAANITWGSATTLVTAGYDTGDVAWTPVNLYIGSVANVLPPEFIKVELTVSAEDDSVDVKWNFGYPAVLEEFQRLRNTGTSRPTPKSKNSLH